MMASYNGWENWETWNVALWIQNDEGLYNAARSAMRRYGTLFGGYKNFIRSYGMEETSTPDGAEYVSNFLNYQELDEMMLEL